MKIRSPWLMLLLPAFIAISILIFLFFYINNTKGTVELLRSNLADISQGNDSALIKIDLNLKLIEQRLRDAIVLIALSSGIALLLLVASAYWIAERITRPLEKLKTAALAIAAGDYAEHLPIEGARDIAELANTLNTMSECLQENLIRLQESSCIRERMHGEYECALLLRQMMLDKVVDDFHQEHLELKLIKNVSKSKPHGLFLQITTQDEAINLILSRTDEAGFKGIFELLTDREKRFPFVKIELVNNFLRFRFINYRMPKPLVWNAKGGIFYRLENEENILAEGDIIILYDPSLEEIFENELEILEWFGKVLRHFSNEDFDLLATMLQNELNFLSKRRECDNDKHILCLKIYS